jgi:hypothetical protein
MKRLLAFSVMFVLVATAAFADPGLALTMAPALILLAALASGFRPGEALIERLSERRRPAALRATSAPRPRLAFVVSPAGRLLAGTLAIRPPPSGLAV